MYQTIVNLNKMFKSLLNLASSSKSAPQRGTAHLPGSAGCLGCLAGLAAWAACLGLPVLLPGCLYCFSCFFQPGLSDCASGAVAQCLGREAQWRSGASGERASGSSDRPWL